MSEPPPHPCRYASMKKYILIILSFFLFLAVVSSCASIDPALLTEKQIESTVSLAREKAFAETNELTEQDKLFIRNEKPRFSYYILSGSYAQYSFSWDVDASNRVIVFGQGNILTLEGSTVKKFKIEK